LFCISDDVNRHPLWTVVWWATVVATAAGLGVSASTLVVRGVAGTDWARVASLLFCAVVSTWIWRERPELLGHEPARMTWVTDEWSGSVDDSVARSPHARLDEVSSEMEQLGACVACLGESLRGQEMDVGLLGLHVGVGVAEVLWSGLPPAPRAPWREAPSGWVWQARMAELLADAGGSGSPGSRLLPALVAIGATRLGVLYLNLEAFRLVTLVGEAEDRAACLGVLLRGLEQAVGAGGCEGFVVDAAEHPVAEASDADGLVQPLEDVLQAIHRRARAVSQGLAGSGCVSAFEARANGGSPDRFSPLVAVADSTLPQAGVDRLLEAGRRTSAVTCVLAGGHAVSDLVLECRAGRVWPPFLSNVGVVLPAAPEADAGDEPTIASALAEQSAGVDDSESAAEDGLENELELVASSVPSAVAELPLVTAAPDGRVIVRVLGPIGVEGGSHPLMGKNLELIVYLACHPEGVPADRVKAALWPERAPHPKTWTNRLSVCRGLLGSGPDGGLVFPHFEGQMARLSPTVRTDVELIDAALERCGTDPGSARAVLHAALTLVRGRPFDAPNGYEWAYRELHVAHAERVIADAAHTLAARALEVGEWREALWASEQGLLVVPGDESLYQDRMRAFHVGGDTRGVDAAMRDLLAAVGGDEPAGALHPDTIELYEELRASPPPAPRSARTPDASR
jgi:hypothetical protein